MFMFGVTITDRTITVDVTAGKKQLSGKYKLPTLSENESLQQILKGRKFLDESECLTIMTDLYADEKTESCLDTFIREKFLEKLPKGYFETDGKFDGDKVQKMRALLKARIKKKIEEYTENERAHLKNLFPTKKTKRISSLKLYDYAQENSNIELPKWFADTQTRLKLDKQKQAKAREERQNLKKEIAKKDKTIEQKDKDIETLKAEIQSLKEEKKRRATKTDFAIELFELSLIEEKRSTYNPNSIANKTNEYAKKVGLEKYCTNHVTIGERIRRVQERVEAESTNGYKFQKK